MGGTLLEPRRQRPETAGVKLSLCCHPGRLSCVSVGNPIGPVRARVGCVGTPVSYSNKACARVRNYRQSYRGQTDMNHSRLRLSKLSLGLIAALAAAPAFAQSTSAGIGGQVTGADRSEEHTSELQSLMRISYAVF